MKEAEKIENKKTNLSFFHLYIPTILLSILFFIPRERLGFSGGLILTMAVIIIVLWQYVAIKNFVESIYN